jgi:hypothetical protein
VLGAGHHVDAPLCVDESEKLALGWVERQNPAVISDGPRAAPRAGARATARSAPRRPLPHPRARLDHRLCIDAGGIVSCYLVLECRPITREAAQIQRRLAEMLAPLPIRRATTVKIEGAEPQPL